MSYSKLNNDQFSLKFNNKSASNWISDNSYTGYSYKCDIDCPGVTEDMLGVVMFSTADADSSNYSTFCITSTDKVTIYSKVNNTITIPYIMVL